MTIKETQVMKDWKTIRGRCGEELRVLEETSSSTDYRAVIMSKEVFDWIDANTSESPQRYTTYPSGTPYVPTEVFSIVAEQGWYIYTKEVDTVTFTILTSSKITKQLMIEFGFRVDQ